MPSYLFNILGLIFIFVVYIGIIVAFKHALHDRGHWLHRDGGYKGWGRIGSVIGLVFFLPPFGILILIDKITSGTSRAVLLSVIGLVVIVMAPVVMIGFAKRRGIFRTLPR